MKKNILLLASTIFMLMNHVAKSQTFINGDFENWTHTGNYDTPDSINTLNSNLNSFGAAANVIKTNDAYHGSWAAELTTTYIALLTRNVPGVITNGVYNVSYFTTTPPTGSPVAAGKRINYRPAYFNGWFKYTRMGNDTALMNIIFTKWNKTTGKTDTLGAAQWMDTVSYSTYQHFSLPINYTLSGVPDTFQFYALSSGAYNAHTGTALYLDSLNFGPPPPSVQFTSQASMVDTENIGDIFFPIQLSTTYNDTVKIYFATSGSATSGVDYTILSANPIILAPGATTDTVKVHIIDDLVAEPTDTLMLRISHTYNCMAIGNDSILVKIIDNDGTGITTINNSNKLSVYPNPSNETVTIEGKNNLIGNNLKVFNALGQTQLVMNKITSNKVVLNVANFNNGVYYFLLETPTGAIVGNGKLVVSK